MDEILKNGNNPLLENILNELKKHNINKWGTKTVDDFYPGYLTDAEVRMKETNIKELNIIAIELRCLTGRNWYSPKHVEI